MKMASMIPETLDPVSVFLFVFSLLVLLIDFTVVYITVIWFLRHIIPTPTPLPVYLHPSPNDPNTLSQFPALQLCDQDLAQHFFFFFCCMGAMGTGTHPQRGEANTYTVSV